MPWVRCGFLAVAHSVWCLARGKKDLGSLPENSRGNAFIRLTWGLARFLLFFFSEFPCKEKSLPSTRDTRESNRPATDGKFTLTLGWKFRAQELSLLSCLTCKHAALSHQPDCPIWEVATPRCLALVTLWFVLCKHLPPCIPIHALYSALGMELPVCYRGEVISLPVAQGGFSGIGAKQDPRAASPHPVPGGPW